MQYEHPFYEDMVEGDDLSEEEKEEEKSENENIDRFGKNFKSQQIS